MYQEMTSCEIFDFHLDPTSETHQNSFVLQVSSWSLGGNDVPDEPEGGVNRDPTSETLPRLHLSSKSLPGVLEDVEIPDEPGGGVI